MTPGHAWKGYAASELTNRDRCDRCKHVWSGASDVYVIAKVATAMIVASRLKITISLQIVIVNRWLDRAQQLSVFTSG